MKALSAALLLALTAGTSHAENLTQADREALLEKLESIRTEADSKVDARFRAAMSAFKSAMSSESAAFDLYLKCEEMVNFDEMKKKSGDFREWKRKNDGRLSEAEFKLALRYQLRWLVLTLEAASDDPDPDHLALEAAKILDSIVAQAEDLYPFKGVLDQSVTGSVFARAYDINGIKIQNWPLSPTQIDPIYDQVLLPPLRQPNRLTALKSTWTKRMVQEGALADIWSGKPGEKKKTGVRSPEYDKFVEDKLPNMQWASEVDLYKAGDERGAAVRMLAHIEENITHKSAPKWAENFISLLQPTAPASPVGEATEDPAP